MGKFFSDSVEKALQYIYYENRTGGRRGQEGLKLLNDAAAAGDGDAACILARCLCGTSYVWSGHHFPEDDERAEQLLVQSVTRGSAIGALVAMRSGVMTPELEAGMPFTLQEAFEQVLEKAAGGDPFCQYTVGNSYFWWDFVSIQGRSPQDFPTPEAFHAFMVENITKCEDWFWRAFRGGMYFGGNNLYNYYLKGDEDFVAPQPEKAAEIFKLGAEMGYPIHQMIHAQNLEEAGDMAGAMEWYRKAAEGGEPGAWYKLAERYEKGMGIPQDPAEALRCYQKSAESQELGGCNIMGERYYLGKDVPQDRAKAYQYLDLVNRIWGNNYAVHYLARCCLEGWGAAPDYKRAYTLAWDTKDRPMSLYVLGRIYCDGLGQPEDIKRGAEFLQRAGNLPEAQEELKKYKKTLFGRWVRR